MLTRKSARVAEARRLLQGKFRRESHTFLVEGAQAIREALAHADVQQLFLTPAFARHEPDLLAAASGVLVHWCDDSAIGAMTDTRAPQGAVAVVNWAPASLAQAFANSPRLIVGLVGASDPGNLGSVIRVADAVGADAVVLTPDSVDPTNPKVVRATTGSLFHLPVVPGIAPEAMIESGRTAGLIVYAATGNGTDDLDALADSGELSAPTLWLFGSEAHGLAPDVVAAADRSVRIPMAGQAESLNLATAAAICSYASARAHRRSDTPGTVYSQP